MRIIKVIETSNTGLPGKYRYARKALRVVECEEGQNGYLSERGVKLLWQSDHYSPGSKGPRSKYHALRAEAERIAEQARLALSLGLVSDAPDYIVHDAAIDADTAR